MLTWIRTLIPTHKTTGEGKKSCRRGSKSLNKKKTSSTFCLKMSLRRASKILLKSRQDIYCFSCSHKCFLYQRNKLDLSGTDFKTICDGSYSSLFSFLLSQSFGNFFSAFLGTGRRLSFSPFPLALWVMSPFLVFLAPHPFQTTSSQTITSTE